MEYEYPRAGWGSHLADFDAIAAALVWRGFFLRKDCIGYTLTDDNHLDDRDALEEIFKECLGDHHSGLLNRYFELTPAVLAPTGQLDRLLNYWPRGMGETSIRSQRGWEVFQRRTYGYKVPVRSLDPGIALLVKSLSAVGVLMDECCSGHALGDDTWIIMSDAYSAKWCEWILRSVERNVPRSWDDLRLKLHATKQKLQEITALTALEILARKEDFLNTRHLTIKLFRNSSCDPTPEWFDSWLKDLASESAGTPEVDHVLNSGETFATDARMQHEIAANLLRSSLSRPWLFYPGSGTDLVPFSALVPDGTVETVVHVDQDSEIDYSRLIDDIGCPYTIGPAHLHTTHFGRAVTDLLPIRGTISAALLKQKDPVIGVIGQMSVERLRAAVAIFLHADGIAAFELLLANGYCPRAVVLQDHGFGGMTGIGGGGDSPRRFGGDAELYDIAVRFKRYPRFLYVASNTKPWPGYEVTDISIPNCGQHRTTLIRWERSSRGVGLLS